MRKKEDYNKYIDAFLFSRLPNETPTYIAMLRDRIMDMINRDVSISASVAYLASAGWSRDIAIYYKEFLRYVEDMWEKDINEMSNNEKQQNEVTFTETQVTTLLLVLTEDLAKHAGFRAPEGGETAKEYRKAFSDFLDNIHKSSVDPEVAALMAAQLDPCIETLKAHKAYYQQMATGEGA